MKKTLKISGIALLVVTVILIFLVLTPFIFRDKFAGIVKSAINKNLKTELNFSEMDVSFFHHFPKLTVTLTNFTLKASAPFDTDTVIKASDVSFGIDLMSLFRGPITVNTVYLNKGKVCLKYNEKGQSNFDVLKAETDTVQKAGPKEASNFSLKIEHIIFIKSDFLYSDPSLPLKISVFGINYNGKSMLEKDILRLDSRVKIDSLDFYYNHIPLVHSKPVKANLITSIDMNTLSMKFEKNDLNIKDIPFEFRAEFNFRKDGYTFFISLFSMFGDEYASGSLWLVSSQRLFVALKADINMTLQNWVKGFGITDTELRGLFTMKINAQGEYYSGQNPASNKPDTIPLSIPDFTVSSTLKNGYFHYKKLPSSIDNISFDLKASAKDHDYRTFQVQLEGLKTEFMKNRIEGFFRLNGLADLPVSARLSTKINLAEIRQVIPMDSLDLKGMLDLDLDVNGKYAPARKLFPVARINLALSEGFLNTKYYPHPVEKISAKVTITNKTGKLEDTRIQLTPLSFEFEGNPFFVNADLSNPDNLSYKVVSKGTLELAKIYRVFSQKGLDLDGFISTDLNLQGRQSDAMAGRIELLHNSGKLVLRDIAVRSEYLPLPVVIKSGVFRFDNDKIWFEKFESRLGASDITMDGHLSNVVNYVLADRQVLKGSFSLRSEKLVAEDFMAPAEPASVTTSQAKGTSQASEGVIVIPENLEIGLKAEVNKIRFGTTDITDFSSSVEIKKGLLVLKSMNFGLAGCKVSMDATYGSIDTKKAFFDFHVKADEFDIRRAYNEVELFRNLSTTAGKCEGIVSLDYSLKGNLDNGMKPIYPSLEGGGVITVKKVKVMGYQLFNAMSKNLGKEKINNPDLSKVEIKSTIKKNVITIERTKMKIAGFRFRVEGQTNFNGSLNLKTRLGLPPLGIVGIPIRVLGTQDTPKFKYGRGVNDQDVDETEYSDEIPREFLDKVKSAKEEELKDEPEEK
jgi:AsmA protein